MLLAEALLSEPALTLLLSAQAAQLTGDREGAARTFTAMLEDDQMAFLGLRGLIAQSLRDGNQVRALEYAERAFAHRQRQRLGDTQRNGALGGEQRTAEYRSLPAFLGGEETVARTQRQPVRLAKGIHADDFDLEIQVPHHAADDG